MLKKTSCLLFLFLAVTQAAKIEEIYGDWVQAAFYPVSGYIPVCIRFLFNKATEDMQCSYSDGSKANSVQMSMITEPGALYAQSSIPVTIVDTYEEVMPVLNLTCKCGDKEVRDAVVTRMVNEDTFVMYTNKSPEGSSEENSAYLFTRGPVSSEKLYGLMTSIEDLKNRRGAMMCATENYDGFKKN